MIVFLALHTLAQFVLPKYSFTDVLITCTSDQDEKNCYKKQLLDLADKQGVRAAMETIQMSKNKFPDLYYKCHEISHLLGMRGFEETKDVVNAINLTSDPALCLHGYLHGVLTAYFETTFTPDVNLATLAHAACGQFSQAQLKKNSDHSCYHGVGHGLAIATDFDLPQALHYCDSISKDKKIINNCYNGVFMENAWLARTDDMHSHHHISSAYFKVGDPSYPCKQLPEKYMPMCAIIVPQQYFYEHAGNKNIIATSHEMFAYCRMNMPLAYQHACFYGIGEITAHATGLNHKETVIENCLQGASWDERNECFRAVVQRYTWVDTNQARDFCNQIPDEHKKTCYALL